MAFAHYPVTVSVETLRHPKTSILASSLLSSSESLFSLAFSSASHMSKARKLSSFSKFSRMDKGNFLLILYLLFW